MIPVAEALVRVVWPETVAFPDTERLVVEALVIVVCPVVREAIVVVARVDVPVTARVPVVVLLVVVRLVIKAVTVLRTL